MILGNIKLHHGSTSAFDAALKLQLLIKPLSYRVDTTQLLERSKGTRWRFDGVAEWLRTPSGNGRALCLLAGAGTGKSSVSTKICQLMGRDDLCPALVGDPLDAALDPRILPVSAVHFVKHNDQRRLEPVQLIKSLAFQLAASKR